VRQLARRYAGLGPGIALAVLAAVIARLAAQAMPPFVSEVSMAVVVGLLVGNTVELSPRLSPGLRHAMGRFLRIGIVLLGAQLSFGFVLELGLAAVGIVLALVAGTFVFVAAVGRMLGLEARPTLLIAVGTAICGNTAILGTAPIISARDRDISLAVGLITIFGSAAVLLYPAVGGILGLDPTVFGYWAGTAVNDTSQVVATGFAYGDRSGEVATVVKLTRNLLLAPVLFLVALAWPRFEPSAASRPRYVEAIPLFVVGFIGMASLNSLGILDAPVLGRDLAAWSGELARVLILVALAATGLTTRLDALRDVGMRPVYLAVAAALTLAVTSLLLVSRVLGS
jgi:uncharacterized integral membrane protein (TIGR00698 family)